MSDTTYGDENVSAEEFWSAFESQMPKRFRRWSAGTIVRYDGDLYEVLTQPFFDAEMVLQISLRAVDAQTIEIEVPLEEVDPVNSLEALGDSSAD